MVRGSPWIEKSLLWYPNWQRQLVPPHPSCTCCNPDLHNTTHNPSANGKNTSKHKTEQDIQIAYLHIAGAFFFRDISAQLTFFNKNTQTHSFLGCGMDARTRVAVHKERSGWIWFIFWPPTWNNAIKMSWAICQSPKRCVLISHHQMSSSNVSSKIPSSQKTKRSESRNKNKGSNQPHWLCLAAV